MRLIEPPTVEVAVAAAVAAGVSSGDAAWLGAVRPRTTAAREATTRAERAEVRRADVRNLLWDRQVEDMQGDATAHGGAGKHGKAWKPRGERDSGFSEVE
ncbi:hypothetical protein GCM10014713_12510 [Streptomyces purpureus]|uniref:Uncharacterized protein n=1 Tax=Streptomyces purpureus TaxID=1951 RepID=A0A918LML1_9ACTN|nr:hypothetical protein GCM10014713_12510 [Streptomyces purpureus]